MKQILIALFSIVLILTACAPAVTVTPVFLTQEPTATPSPIPTSTNTSIPSATPTASTTPLPTIPTFTPTFDELIQPNPFLTDTPNPNAQVIAQKWNSKNFSLSPDGKWVAIIDFGILRIIQTQGEQEFTIACEIFVECEFIIPLQWSPDSHKLYVVPLLTGEFLVTFPLNTGIGRIDVKTGKFEKLVEDGMDEGDYNASLSPDGNYISITDMREKPPKFIIMETTNFQEIAEKEINVTLDPRDYGIVVGNMIWTRTMEGIVFLVQSTSSLSSILYYDIETKTITTIVEKDPTFVELLFIDENNHVALSKTTYYPFSKSYWYLDLARKEFIPIATATPES